MEYIEVFVVDSNCGKDGVANMGRRWKGKWGCQVICCDKTNAEWLVGVLAKQGDGAL